MSIAWVAGGRNFSGIAQIAYSSDGINYTNSSNASIFGSYVWAIAHNGVLWVAGGTPNGGSTTSIGYSYDANTWYTSSTGNSILSSNVYGIAYGNNKFVAIGGGTTYVTMYSTDGINWTGGMTAAAFGAWGMRVVYRNSLWVICGGTGASGNQTIAYSSDGINWTKASTTGMSAETRMIDFNGTRWVAVGLNPQSATTNVMYSNTRDVSGSWTVIGGVPYSNRANYVKWGGDRFIVNGYPETKIRISTDGVNWSDGVSSNFGTSLAGAINWNNNFWLMGQQTATTKALLYSNDNGSTWSPCSIPNSHTIFAVAYSVPPPDSVGAAPIITSVTNDSQYLYVNFTPSTGGYPTPTTYYYSIDNGATYTNANTTNSPITIGGLIKGVEYNVTLIAQNRAGNTVASNIGVGKIPYPCFLQGTQILRQNCETGDAEYVPVETLRKGDRIKTFSRGYVPIHIIGHTILHQPKDNPKTDDRLYRFTPDKCPELFEDLCITGNHCILYTKLDGDLKSRVQEHMGDIYVTEGYYRVPACLDERSMPYEKDGPAAIWHFALENDNIYENYGVFANGLLVESSSIRYMTELSGMKFVE